jgi:crotonobetainyl-CoA:carnitine CoA-transferase CaiB-like acyl-CoA transferase
LKALSPFRIVDLSENRAGAYCTKLMAGFGAEVIKVEPPGGDALRRHGPFFRDAGGEDHSIPAAWYHTGKKSITLDWNTTSGRDELRALLGTADAVVESFRPGTLEGWGMGYDALRARRPGLVLTSVTNFGQTGPYRDFAAEEITLYAMCGAMKLTGDPAREPLHSGSNACHAVAGMWAYIGTLQALLQRARTGTGQWIDVSIHECALDSVETHLVYQLRIAHNPNRDDDHHTLVPWENYECRDGQATIVSNPIRHWFSAADMFEEPALKTSRYFTARDRMDHRAEVADLMRPWLLRHTRREVFETGHRHHQAFGMLMALDEVFDLPQHRDRSYFIDVAFPGLGRRRVAGWPFRCGDCVYETAPPPAPGEHNGALAPRPAPPEAPTDTGPAPAGEGPLAGIRVLDFSKDWASPHVTRILADSGAEVILVEHTGLLCLFRGSHTTGQKYNQHPGWHEINRNKTSITLDLRVDRDHAIVRDLIATCDVVVENSRTGVMDRLGLGYEAIRAIRPDIIMLSFTGYGGTGPWAGRPAMGAAVETTSGIQSLTGYPDTSRRYRIKELDVCAGVMGAGAVMTALLQRSRDHEGRHIDFSMMESTTHAQIGEHLLYTDLLGAPPPTRGNRHLAFAPQGAYPCRGEDAWVALAIRDPAEWRALCDVIGRPEWKTTPAMQHARQRQTRHDAIDQAIREWTRGRDHYEAMTTLQQAGVPAGAVLSMAELIADPHVKARGLLAPCERGGTELYPVPPIRMSGAALRLRSRGPDLGEHNRTWIHEVLGRPLQDVPQIDETSLFSAFHPHPDDRPSDADAHQPARDDNHPPS